MQVDLDQTGLAHLTLEPGEQIVVKIGGAEVMLIGGTADASSDGPLVQIVLEEPGAHLKLKHGTPHAEGESFAVRVVEDGQH